jgi:hypothetical protein
MIYVYNYKEENERMIREQNRLNSQLILNQLQRQINNVSNSRREEEGRYHERRDNYIRDGYSRSASISHSHQ